MNKEIDVAAAYAIPTDQLLLTWYDSELLRTTGIGYDEAQSFGADFVKSFSRWCADHSLKTKVCDEWEYCRKLKAHGRKVDLVLALTGFLSAILVISAVGAVSAAVLIVREGLGVACECD
jgi:hypothetical protein